MRIRATKTNTESRREQIVQAAVDLIDREGMSGLSMAAIAGRVGIVPSALYRHYRNKEALLDGVMARVRARMMANAAAVREEVSGARDRLRILLFRHADMLMENRAFIYVIFASLSYNENLNRREVLRQTICDYREAIERIVAEGQRNGEIRGDLSPRTTAVMFLGLILPGAVLARLSGGEFDPRDHVRRAWPAFERGLVPERNLKSNPARRNEHACA